jgi:phosphatidylinositol-3-phosphatase
MPFPYPAARCALAAAVLAAGLAVQAAAAPALLEGVPRYDHVFVIVEENKDYDQILSPAAAPHIAGLATKYGDAAQFFGEGHPSEGNYVALLGGDNLGMHDDDAFYCKPGSTEPYCGGATKPGYRDHTAHTPHLGDQLAAAGLTWKGYYENLPEAGSLAIYAGDPKSTNTMKTAALYASKHTGFTNFESTIKDPRRAEHLVDFGQLDRDLAADDLPSFALIVPNQCNEMHGLGAADAPADCKSDNTAGLIRRGDAYTGELVHRLQSTKAWAGRGNVAIVITFDEGVGGSHDGCCDGAPAGTSLGGGHIPTIVITNHGPRGLQDRTAYNHYSLLRTLEDAFGIGEHLGHAADTAKGVRAMTPLFAIK